MPVFDTQLAVLVTASAEGDQLRRELTRCGVTLGSATASLAQLRRTLVRGSEPGSIVLCITLDAPTLRRHGRALARILDDRASFATPVHAIGMMTDTQPAEGWAAIGCDAVASDLAELQRLLQRFQTTSRGLAPSAFPLRELSLFSPRHAARRGVELPEPPTARPMA